MIKSCWLVGISLAIVFVSNSARACTCELPPLDKSTRQQVIEARQKAKAVFVGKVLAIDAPSEVFYKRITFELESAWKGVHSTRLVIFTGRGGGDCGYGFEVGETYLVFAYQFNKSHLGTNICQRTGVFSSASNDLKHLGKVVFKARRTQATILTH
jgi:hypothetical protein